MDNDDTISAKEFISEIWVNEMQNNGNMATTDIFSKGTEIYSRSLEYFASHKNNKTLVHMLTSTDCVSEDEAKNCVHQFLKICPGLSQLRQKLITFASSGQVADEDLLGEVNASVQTTTDKTLMTSSASSFVCVFVDASTLIVYWQDLRGAKEFSSRKFVEEIADIQRKMKKIATEINKLIKEMNEYNFAKMTGEERYWYHSKKSRKLDSIRKKIDSADTDIGKLQAKVNGKIERLSTIRGNANSSALLQGVQGVGQTGMTILNRGTASNWSLAATAASAVAHFTASISHIFLGRDSQDTINQLEDKLSEIRILRHKLADMLEELDDHFEDFSEAIELRNEHLKLEKICAA